MIANKTNQMSFETLALDSALWPADQSFFGKNWSDTQSYGTQPSPQLVSSDDQWLQDFEVFTGLCEDIDLDLNYDPQPTLEVMTKEVDNEYRQTKIDEYVDYLESTAFLSPESLAPHSPEIAVNDDLELDLTAQDLNSTSAMTILEEILSSANSSDNENDCFDSELDLQSITEVSKGMEITYSDSTSLEALSPPKRRQTKRKASDAVVKTVVNTATDVTKAVASKRRKSTVLEKKERKRNQNKSAANRYRVKKRAELDSIEDLEQTFAKTNQELKTQLQKLQMEFKVVLPLAKAAFASDANKALQLQMLDIRVLNDNLLD